MGHYPNIFFLLLQRTHLEVRRLRKLIPFVLMGVNLRNLLKMCCVHCSREGRGIRGIVLGPGALCIP